MADDRATHVTELAGARTLSSGDRRRIATNFVERLQLHGIRLSIYRASCLWRVRNGSLRLARRDAGPLLGRRAGAADRSHFLSSLRQPSWP